MSEKVRRAYLRHIAEKYVSKRRHNCIYVHELCGCPIRATLDKMLQKYSIIDISNMSDKIIIGELLHEGIKNVLTYEECYEPTEKCRILTINGRDIEICGTADILCEGEVIEVKYVSKTDKVVNNSTVTPYEHHILQVRLYGWLYSVDRCVLLYITPTRIVHVVEKPLTDDEVVRHVESWLSWERTPMWDWECRYCRYVNMCEYAKR